jgi:ATP-dependent Lhr-like helicase
MRHGIVTREIVAAESVSGGFTAVYEVLKAMEDTGRVRRGYFVAGLGGAQFAMPAALDQLRALRDLPEQPHTLYLAATDPANPYGSILKWPASTPQAEDTSRGPTRSVGALVVIVDGAAAAYLRRGERELLLFLPDDEPRRSRIGHEVARALIHLASGREEGRRGMLIVEINGAPATAHPSARLFINEGFLATAMGLQARPPRG